MSDPKWGDERVFLVCGADPATIHKHAHINTNIYIYTSEVV